MRVRTLWAVVAGLVAGGAILPDVQAASSIRDYPWCTTSAGHEFGAQNCGFMTFEQCMQTARGNGQMCEQSPWYVPPAAPVQRNRKVRRGEPRNN